MGDLEFEILNERNVEAMFKTIQVMLLPNNKQRTKLFQCFGVSRFAYNWALNRQQENYKNGVSLFLHLTYKKNLYN